MNYVSTRGGAPPVSFLDAVLTGLAPDGGLYVPESWPRLNDAEIAAFGARPYAEVAAKIVSRFAGDEIDITDLAEMCDDAYASFSHVAVAPLVQLAPGRFLLELFHGPSLAFKDVALQLLARLYDHALAKLGRRLTIVCATSGDTGGAAVEAFRGRANVRIVTLFPEGRISEVQRRFMTTAREANVASLAVNGYVRRLSDDAERDVPRHPVQPRGGSGRRSIRSTSPASSPRASTTSPRPSPLARRAARSPSPCPPATSATPTPVTWRAGWDCRSSG